MILAPYLRCRPADVSFRSASHGKPRLDPANHGQRVWFNVSHSHELALVSVTAIGEVGIDIERVRLLEDVDDLVARHFSCQERQVFARTTPAGRLRTFFRYWTIKEAYLKALGIGLSGPLHAVDVTAVRQRHARLTDHHRPTAGGEWIVRPLSPGAGYVGAVAVQGRRCRLRRWRWTA